MSKEILYNLTLSSGKFDHEREYWLKKLSGVEQFELPLEYQRIKNQGRQYETLEYKFTAETTAQLWKLARNSDHAAYLILLVAIKYLLSIYTHREDIVVIAPISKQERDQEYLNYMLAIRSQIHSGMTFKEMLLQVKQNMVEANGNPNFPLVKVAEELELTYPTESFPFSGITAALESIHDLQCLDFGHHDLSFIFRPGTVEMECKLEYDATLFRKTSIWQMMSQLETVMQLCMMNPDTVVKDLDMISKGEKEKLLVEFNQTELEYPKDKSIHQLFQEQVDKYPDQIALVDQEQQMTYQELNAKANQLARVLREKGVQSDQIVGIMIERSCYMFIGLLGILKAGGAYLPIDPDYPKDRIQYMMTDSQLQILLTQQSLKDQVSFTGEVICLDDSTLYQGDDFNLEYSNPKDLAYVIYTSGSTGRPKAVMVEHGNVVNFIAAMTTQIDFCQEKTILALTTISFDIFVLETWVPLANGLCVIVANEEQQHNMAELKELLLKHEVNLLQITPSRLKILMDTDPDLESLQTIETLLVGGEAFPPQVLNKLQKSPRFQGQIFNMYGPTETTVWSTMQDLTELSEINIGKPIGNTQIYILNSAAQLTPLGVMGELCIGGAGVTRGYLNNPQLTEERFIPHPIDQTRGRVYRTGDQARWLADGNIQFLGRGDHQVKIRGYRIELGEIEKSLASHPQINKAVVIDKIDEQGEKYLCAYLVLDEKESDEEVHGSTLEFREFLAQVLPEYMIPSYFVYLDQIPLTPNGKINRKALPEPDHSLRMQTEYLTPRNETERILAEIWSDILGVEQVGIHDNFFLLGGQSFKAMLVSSRILSQFDVKVAVRELFAYPTIEELAVFICQANTYSYQVIEKVPLQDYYAVSAAQKRLYILDQFDSNSISYNIPNVFPMDQRVDLERVEMTLLKLIQRHEVLRTSFKMVNEKVVQVVHDDVNLKVRRVQASDENLEEVLQENIYPFDLKQAPLLHATIIETPDQNLFLLDVHHIVFDGFSTEILFRDFMHLYEGVELAELPIQYKDFAAWQNQFLQSEEMKEQAEYWFEKFAGEIPLLNLPTDYPRPNILDFAGDQVFFKVDQNLKSQLQEFTLQKGVTLYMTLLAAYFILLAKYSGQEDLIIGTPYAGRHHSGTEGLIGMFVNTLAFRSAPTAEKSIMEFLAEIKDETLRGSENQDYQFDMLVQKLDITWDTSRNPLFDVLFILQNMGSVVQAQEQSLNLDLKISKFDLTLTGVEFTDGIKFAFEYRTSLFKRQTIEKLATHYLHILEQIVTSPELPISEIDLLSVAEKEKVLLEFNATQVGYKPMTIQELFEEQVAQTPNQVALVVGGEQVTYQELNQKANQLARVLKQKGVQTGDIVGLMVQRSVEMIVGLLGILKAGGAYLPIDPAYPEERIQYMLEHSQVQILLIKDELEKEFHFAGEIIDLSHKSTYHADFSNPGVVSQPRDLAYVIYTSGSTGKPKGVMIEHRSVHNFIIGVTEKIDFRPTKTILCITTISFDIFVLETLLPLTKGLKVVVADEEEQMNPQRLVELIQLNDVDLVQSTPSRIQLLSTYDPQLSTLQGVQEIMIGGEEFPKELLMRLKSKVKARIYNMYGPTETTVWSTIQELTDLDEINIGKPVANTQIYILDGSRNLVPPHVKGELYIGGSGLARGYLNQPELTDERFVPNPFLPGEKMYRTGDLAMWQLDGNIKFMGRADHQVKIRGYRIELGEIENQLLKYESMNEVVVIDLVDSSENRYLCAYFNANRELSVNELRMHLAQSLPEYMIPSYFVQLKELPKTPNGKIDRLGLPEPDQKIITGNEYVKYRNETEEKLVEIWSDLFGVDKEQISIKDKFFEIGGNSLKVINLMNRVNKEFETNLQVTDLFKYTTIEMIAEVVGPEEDTLTEEEELKFTY